MGISKIINYESLGLRDFLQEYPGMAVRPIKNSWLNIEGKFNFTAKKDGNEQVIESYQLQIKVPVLFPRDLPAVVETNGRIPRDGNHHTNKDGSLCLGSPIRLLKILSESPNLIGFTDRCLIPYLYAMSHKLNGEGFIFGELDHGFIGELDDYCKLFKLRSIDQALMSLKFLALKKRRANKFLCPCGCGRRLGQCQLNKRINKVRLLADRKWFKKIFDNNMDQIRNYLIYQAKVDSKNQKK